MVNRRYFFRFTNIAVTLFAASMVTVQVGSTPLHAPLQPTNADLPEAVAVNVTVPVAGCAMANEQLFRQLCPVSLTTTVPRFFFDTTMPSVTVCPVEGGVAGFSGVTGGVGVGSGGVGVGVGSGVGGVGVGVGSGLGVGTAASTVTLTTCVARSPLVAPVMPVPTWNVPASCDEGT